MPSEIPPTLGNLLLTLKGPAFQGQNWSIQKGAGFSPNKTFEHMLFSCLTEANQTGSTDDCIPNPYSTKYTALMRCLLPDHEMRKKAIESLVNQKYLAEYRKNSHVASISKGHIAMGRDSTGKTDEKDVQGTASLSERENIEKSIKKAALKYNLPPNLIKGIVRAESDFQARAVSRAGAMGLMQLMPATAKELGVNDPFDIDQNIDAGTRYLKSLLNRFDNDLKTALAAYNAGPGTVKRYGGDVPYPETKNYVKRVIEYSKKFA